MPLLQPRLSSVEAFHQIKEDGTIAGRRLLVLEVLAHSAEPLTRSEIGQHLKSIGQKISNNGVGSRTTELTKLGVIRELPKRICRVTGKKVLTFEATGELPTRTTAPKRLDRRKVLKALKVAIEALNHLRAAKSMRLIAEALGIEETEVLESVVENIQASGPVDAD